MSHYINYYGIYVHFDLKLLEINVEPFAFLEMDLLEMRNSLQSGSGVASNPQTKHLTICSLQPGMGLASPSPGSARLLRLGNICTQSPSMLPASVSNPPLPLLPHRK